MFIRILSHDRKWKPPLNHLDKRVCPRCAAGVYGQAGQNTHRDEHEAADRLLAMLCEAAGVTAGELGDQEWVWTAEIEPEPEGIEAAE